MSNEGRETVIVPEKKEKIERIKRKYNNMAMTDDTAKKIKNLEVVNNVLLVATGIVGVATVVNYFVPDPVPGIDEAIMTGATALLGSASTIVKNKINDLAATGTTEMKMEEVTNLSSQMADIAKKVSEKRGAIAKTH